MLDKRTTKLLDVILRICGDDGAYKIIEIHDLIKGMLPKFKIDAENLTHMLKFLGDLGMLDIKYSDEQVHCIAILPKGRVYEEAKLEKKTNKAIGKGLAFFIVFGSFVAAMLGAFLANIILYSID